LGHECFAALTGGDAIGRRPEVGASFRANGIPFAAPGSSRGIKCNEKIQRDHPDTRKMVALLTVAAV
jgi:hypothetical protein